MINQKTIEDYGFNNINDYFIHIIESKINGNLTQVKSLISELDKEQKTEFVDFCDEEHANYYRVQYDNNDYLLSVDFCRFETIDKLMKED